MDENPDKSPSSSEKHGNRSRETQPFLRLPTTFIEWLVIVLVLIAIAALLLPNVD
jgi:hypothetical protein